VPLRYVTTWRAVSRRLGDTIEARCGFARASVRSSISWSRRTSSSDSYIDTASSRLSQYTIDKEEGMPVARVTEISSTSTSSFEDAIKSGLDRANQTLRNVKSAWIKEQQVRLDGGAISEYQVNMLVTFVLDD
jgi:dodecin